MEEDKGRETKDSEGSQSSLIELANDFRVGIFSQHNAKQRQTLILQLEKMLVENFDFYSQTETLTRSERDSCDQPFVSVASRKEIRTLISLEFVSSLVTILERMSRALTVPQLLIIAHVIIIIMRGYKDKYADFYKNINTGVKILSKLLQEAKAKYERTTNKVSQHQWFALLNEWIVLSLILCKQNPEFTRTLSSSESFELALSLLQRGHGKTDTNNIIFRENLCELVSILAQTDIGSEKMISLSQGKYLEDWLNMFRLIEVEQHSNWFFLCILCNGLKVVLIETSKAKISPGIAYKITCMLLQLLQRLPIAESIRISFQLQDFGMLLNSYKLLVMLFCYMVNEFSGTAEKILSKPPKMDDILSFRTRIINILEAEIKSENEEEKSKHEEKSTPPCQVKPSVLLLNLINNRIVARTAIGSLWFHLAQLRDSDVLALRCQLLTVLCKFMDPECENPHIPPLIALDVIELDLCQSLDISGMTELIAFIKVIKSILNVRKSSGQPLTYEYALQTTLLLLDTVKTFTTKSNVVEAKYKECIQICTGISLDLCKSYPRIAETEVPLKLIDILLESCVKFSSPRLSIAIPCTQFCLSLTRTPQDIRNIFVFFLSKGFLEILKSGFVFLFRQENEACNIGYPKYLDSKAKLSYMSWHQDILRILHRLIGSQYETENAFPENEKQDMKKVVYSFRPSLSQHVFTIGAAYEHISKQDNLHSKICMDIAILAFSIANEMLSSQHTFSFTPMDLQSIVCTMSIAIQHDLKETEFAPATMGNFNISSQLADSCTQCLLRLDTTKNIECLCNIAYIVQWVLHRTSIKNVFCNNQQAMTLIKRIFIILDEMVPLIKTPATFESVEPFITQAKTLKDKDIKTILYLVGCIHCISNKEEFRREYLELSTMGCFLRIMLLLLIYPNKIKEHEKLRLKLLDNLFTLAGTSLYNLARDETFIEQFNYLEYEPKPSKSKDAGFECGKSHMLILSHRNDKIKTNTGFVLLLSTVGEYLSKVKSLDTKSEIVLTNFRPLVPSLLETLHWVESQQRLGSKEEKKAPTKNLEEDKLSLIKITSYEIIRCLNTICPKALKSEELKTLRNHLPAGLAAYSTLRELRQISLSSMGNGYLENKKQTSGLVNTSRKDSKNINMVEWVDSEYLNMISEMSPEFGGVSS